MALESVLATLETRIEELIVAHAAAQTRVKELEARVSELEETASSVDDTLRVSAELETKAAAAATRIGELESQRDALCERLEKVLGSIDEILGASADTAS